MRNNCTRLILISTLARRLIGRFRLALVGSCAPVHALVIPSFLGLFVEFLIGFFGPVLDVRHGEILPEIAVIQLADLIAGLTTMLPSKYPRRAFRSAQLIGFMLSSGDRLAPGILKE